MSDTMIGVIGILVLFGFLLMRMPVAVTMMVVGFVGVGILNSWDAAFATLVGETFVMASFVELSVIPLFVLMGNVAGVSGMSRDLYDAAYSWIGGVRGGLASATIFGCAGFAALSGSSVASALTMGRAALPEMQRFKYDDGLATGAVAAGGTLGILIPPSTGFVIYAILTEESIGRLFMAGVLPGLLLTGLFALTIFLITTFHPEMGPKRAIQGTDEAYFSLWRNKWFFIEAVIFAVIIAWVFATSDSVWLRGIALGTAAVFLFTLAISSKERFAALLRAFPIIGIIVITLGGIYFGWFTPVEAAGVGAFLAILVGFYRKALTGKTIPHVLLQTVRTTALSFLILIGAHIFSPFLALSQIPQHLSDILLGLDIGRIGILIIILAAYIIMGTFLEGFAMLVLTLPIIFPLIVELGFDPIWFGVVVVITLEMGLISPPVGVNVFVVKSIAENVPMAKIFKGIFPFWLAMGVCLIILVLFPQIALFLPNSMFN
jgi:TRAP-type C4-dicarboxylate transport system permease large subunit